jgi:hypothetical protein
LLLCISTGRVTLAALKPKAGPKERRRKAAQNEVVARPPEADARGLGLCPFTGARQPGGVEGRWSPVPVDVREPPRPSAQAGGPGAPLTGGSALRSAGAGCRDKTGVLKAGRKIRCTAQHGIRLGGRVDHKTRPPTLKTSSERDVRGWPNCRASGEMR